MGYFKEEPSSIYSQRLTKPQQMNKTKLNPPDTQHSDWGDNWFQLQCIY